MKDKKQPERHWTPPETGSFVDKTNQIWNSKGFQSPPTETPEHPIPMHKQMAGQP